MAEHGDHIAVFADGVDVHILGADHKILVDHGVIDAQGAALGQGLVLKVVNGVGKAHAQGQMAGGVFVEQRVVEQQSGLADGTVVGHQGALAQIGAALVHSDKLGQQVVVLLGVPLHSLARVEANPELVDELPLIAQWLGGVDDTLGLAPLGGDEALLGGDIGVEDNAL